MAEMWHYTSSGKAMEPVTAAELKQLADSGYLKPTDLVWKEGMAEWAKARALNGLFTTTEPPAIPQRAERSDIDELPRRRRDRDDDRPPRRPAAGMSGLVIGLIVGGIGLIVLLVIGGIIVVVALASRGPVANYDVDVGPNMSYTREFDFKTGVLYEFRVSSTAMTDVDLHIVSSQNRIVGMDESVGPNSFLEWSPAVQGRYKVVIRNLDHALGNHSHVTIRNIGKAHGPIGLVDIDPDAQAPQPKVINVQMPNFPPPVVQPPNFQPPGVQPPNFQPPNVKKPKIKR